MKTHCPKCGACKNADGTFTLHKDWPINDKCDECDRRAFKRAYKLGRKWRIEKEKIFFDILMRG